MAAVDVGNWQSQLRKGLLDTVILNLLQHRRCHGYEMVQALKKIDGLQIREGNIYPILARLEMDKLLTSSKQPSVEGPPRKYYEITELGRSTVTEMNRHWDQMNESIKKIRKESLL
jgi:PadR family transcriptional regulator, regulatory protein PadR